MKLAVITPTSGHKGCLDACAKRVSEQTLRCTWLWHEGLDWTENIKVLIQRAREEGFDGVVCFDDDDWYPPDWCEWVAEKLSEAPLVGQKLEMIYHLPAAAWNRLSPRGPLVGTMAVRKDLFTTALNTLSTGYSLKDLFIVSAYERRISSKSTIVGVKGIPDRAHCSVVKHEYSPDRYPNQDPDRSVLRKWVGDEAADDYLAML